MTHDEARERFTARIDDVLEAGERARLDEHLAGCADCRRDLDRLERTVAMLRRARPVHAPAGFAERVVAAAPPVRRRRVARALFRPLRVKLPLQAAALLVVAVTAAWLYRGEPELQDARRAPATTERSAALRREPAAPAPEPERTPPARPREARDRAPLAANADASAPGEAVRASWATADRAAAVREVEALVARLGGAARARHDEADTTVLEVWLPEGAWDAVARELERHGTLRVERGPAAAGPVRATLRITG